MDGLAVDQREVAHPEQCKNMGAALTPTWVSGRRVRASIAEVAPPVSSPGAVQEAAGRQPTIS